jgi:uncharacterized protein (DUF305 family)
LNASTPRRIPRLVLPVIAIIALGAAYACRTGAGAADPPIIQPGAPGQPSREISSREATDLSHVQHTPADVLFMQNMIGHHAQALEMTALVPSRAATEDLKKLALRIEVSQADEIRMMQDWLRARGEPVPDAHAHHAHGSALMPGMLTPAEMARLSEISGPAFDRSFLESMIRHHQGALIMVRDLLATPGAGQDSDVFEFISEVEADQGMEIDRMAAMLTTVKEPK